MDREMRRELQAIAAQLNGRYIKTGQLWIIRMEERVRELAWRCEELERENPAVMMISGEING
jgi:hypothetical protein